MRRFLTHALRRLTHKRKLNRDVRRLQMRRETLRLESLEPRHLMAGDISGTVFNDLNANGIDDPGDPGLAGWTVYIDANNNGALDSGEQLAATDTKGRFSFLSVPAGDVTLGEVLQPGFSPTPGFSDHQTVNVRDAHTTKVGFPNLTAPITTGSVSGTVFEDTNEDGIRETGEHSLAGWTLFIDTNGDQSLSAGEPTATTDTDGNYVLQNVPAGPALVQEIPQGGLAPTIGGLFPTTGALPYHLVNVTAGGTAQTDFANLTPQIGTIQGTVWNDANGDGAQNIGESPLAGRTVFVDLNANGVADSGEPTRVTDASGTYSFANIHTGSYSVSELPPSGWIHADGRPSTVNTTVFLGGVNVVDYFDLVPTIGSISGTIYNDTDGNGLQSTGESGLAGWQVFIDANNNGALDAGEAQATTDASGGYRFDGLPYGFQTIREVTPANWLATNPATGATTIHLLNGENRTGVNFGDREKIGAIQGTIWNDANGDGLRGATEAGLANWTVYLDLNNDGIAEAGEPTAVSDASGSYAFTRLPTGSYTVAELVPAGWINTIGKASSASVTVAIGGVNVVDFYNLVPAPSAVSGTVWNDADANGIQSLGEPGLAGWQVFADLNANGTPDAGEPSATTDDSGAYTLSGVPYGSVVVQEVVQAGFTATSPTGGKASVFVLNGENHAGVNFGNHEPADYVISGTAFFDANKNGTLDAGERGLSGITVYLDTNNNGTLDAGEPSTTSSTDLFFTPAVNETGTYSFTHLARGTYHVREIPPPELSATPAAVQEQIISVGPASQTAVNFANLFRANEIHGVVFDDTNNNHQHDAGEAVHGGVPVYIDVNRDNVYEADEPHTVTAADGSYAFVGLTPGAYIVREEEGVTGPHTYPTTGGGILWPSGVSNPAVGNVTPTDITTSLADGQSFSQTVSLTLPGGGSISNMVDVFLLFDDTGSFTANSPIVRAAFPQIISSLQAALPGTDLGFGVGRFEEYGNFAGEFPTGRPFILNQPIVDAATPGFSTSIQSALDRTAPGYGGDQPETDIEALYQAVTGLGFDGNNNGTVSDSGAAGLASTQLTPGNSGDVPSFASFTTDPANNVLPAAGNIGGAGFRPGALPIILTATDTGFAYQPKGETTITGAGGLTLPISALTQTSRPTTPFNSGAGMQETVTGLNALGALVVGLGTNADRTIDPRQDLESLAKLTGAVNQSTATIPNGTATPIAPGDPLYFQISSGFGTTVADGIVNAIQNAVTNVAMDITLRASDPRVQIINHTGTLTGVGSGQTASFDVQFVGDGRPHRFDLQFVRAGTNVVLGSIPVTLGTPVPGDGYEYDELADGEIHHSSDFGNYVTNVAPSFTAGSDITLAEDAGGQAVTSWATGISAGPASEAGQTLNFLVSSDNPALFSQEPTISADGTLTFTPAPNANGTAIVTVQLHDNGGVGPGGSDTSLPQTFAITVTPVNDAPVAADDSYATLENAPVTLAASGVLANDTDADGDTLTAGLLTPPAHGTVTLNADGSFQYLPAAGFVGTDSFTYQASDGSLLSNTATATIVISRVNHAPVAVNDAYAATENVPLTIGPPGVTANDTDADGDVLTASLVTLPAHGSLTLSADGSFSYVPAANFSGTDSFTYQVNDGALDSNVATVTLSVAAVNSAPVAGDDVYTVSEDSPLAVPAAGLLTNDTDAENDPLTAFLVASPAHGTLTLSGDGSFVYLPAANYNGSDSFTYRANDGSLDSNVATVTVTVTPVNDAPVASDNSYSINEDTALSVAAPGLLGNDTDVDGNVLQAIRLTGPSHGTLSLATNGSFVYVPAANFNGTDSFTYKANDGLLDSNVATVTITIAAVNDPPVALGESYSTNENVALNVPAAGVLANDSDVDGDPLSAVLSSGPTHGTLTLNPDGSFGYTPAAGFSGTDSFTYRASDGLATSGLATVSITVIPPAPPATKFYVVDDGSKAEYRYGADGSSQASNLLNKSDSKPRGIASNATGTTQWVIDGSGTVFVYDNNGILLGQWTPQNVGKPEGITVWGNDLWIVDPNQDRVFFFAGGANLRTGRVNPTSSFALNSGNLNSTDIVTDGAHLWVVNDTTGGDRVFRYTTGGALEGSWAISASNPSPSGITIDPNNVSNIWIVDASTDRVYQYDNAASRLTGSQEPSTSFALGAGNTSPQGIADPAPLAGGLAGPREPSRNDHLVDASLAMLLDDHRGSAREHASAKSAATAALVSPPVTAGSRERGAHSLLHPSAIDDTLLDKIAGSQESDKQRADAVDELFSGRWF